MYKQILTGEKFMHPFATVYSLRPSAIFAMRLPLEYPHHPWLIMKILLLSDTHSHLDPQVLPLAETCDEIWHAGDIGDKAVTTDLKKIKPVRAVFGNIDDPELQSQFPEDLWWTCEGFSIWMTHIGGAPPNFNPRVKKIFKQRTPDIFICGHSHILRVKRDPTFNLLYINPGAAGNQGFHHMKTLLRFELKDKTVSNMEVVEMGRRGAI
jgi:hypothetical protein